MPSERLQFQQWVPFPLDHVFAFFSNPLNLPRIMPTDSGTKIEQSTGWPRQTLGARRRMWRLASFRVFPVLPLRARWIARITEFEWNHYFADVQEKGPFKNWRHRHQFLAETRSGIAGTVVRDVIDYEVGFGFVGAMIDAVFLRRQMQNTFAQRQEVLLKLLP